MKEKKMTDDEIMAQALACPESEKVPLEVGNRVIALKRIDWFMGKVPKGTRGMVLAVDGTSIPWQIDWAGAGAWWYYANKNIGKLVPRRK